MRRSLDIEDIQEKFIDVVNSSAWLDLQEKFNNCKDVYVLGHGGNLAVADHTAIDITRLSGGQKNAICPGSATVVTSLINDTNFDDWMTAWLKLVTANKTRDDLKKSLVYGISSTGTSKDVLRALEWANSAGMNISLITGRQSNSNIDNLTEVVLNTNYYHTAEVLTLILQYELTHGSGRECPEIGKNKQEDIKKSNRAETSIRQHSFDDETKTVAIDFDGVVHKSSMGYYDGTIYDNPVEGVKQALENLSTKYSVVIYTCKARQDRGLVNQKTGTELIWDWLKKHDLDLYISKVTSEKPRAICYIDDRSYRFNTWDKVLTSLRNDGLL